MMTTEECANAIKEQLLSPTADDVTKALMQAAAVKCGDSPAGVAADPHLALVLFSVSRFVNGTAETRENAIDDLVDVGGIIDTAVAALVTKALEPAAVLA